MSEFRPQPMPLLFGLRPAPVVEVGEEPPDEEADDDAKRLRNFLRGGDS